MKTYRICGFLIASIMMIPFLIIPTFYGLSLSDGSFEITDHEPPNDPEELATFKVLDIYYFIFLMISLFPFLVLVLWSFLSRWKEHRDMKIYTKSKEKEDNRIENDLLFKEERFPQVSVLIPCYNEDMYLGSAIKNAYNQSYAGDIEIVVIDDGSRDNTWSIGKIFRTKKGKRTVDVYHKKNEGKASALKFGISKANGKILIMTDGDSEMDVNAVREIVETFRKNPNTGIVGGFVSIKNTSSGYLTKLQQMEYYITQHITRLNQSEDGSVLIAPGPIFGMRSDLARVLPPLDRTIVEDCDLTMSVLSTGYGTRSTTRSVSYTNAPTTWHDWFLQRKRWIYGQFQAWRENKWHLKKNPWGLYTYFTWLTTSISALLFFIVMLWTFGLLIGGNDYYSILEFISLRTLMIAVLYIVSRSTILLSYKKTRALVAYIPLKVIYDLINGYLTCYLYFRYILGLGVRMRWGEREEVIY